MSVGCRFRVDINGGLAFHTALPMTTWQTLTIDQYTCRRLDEIGS